jgi:hypothetical protein
VTPRRSFAYLPTIAAGALVTLALTGCLSEGHPALAVTVTPVPSGASAAPASGAATAPARTAASPGRSTAAPAHGPASTCPVTADTLLTTLKAGSTDIYKRAGRPAALETPTCYGRFAVAQTAFNGTTQQAYVLFGFDATSGTWRPLNLGSAEFCTGYVPTDVAAHLPGCA